MKEKERKKEKNEQKSASKGVVVLVAVLCAALLGTTVSTAVLAARQPKSELEVITDMDGAVSVRATNTKDGAEAMGYMTVEEGEEIRVRSILSEDGEVTIQLREKSEDITADPLYEYSVSSVKNDWYSVPAGEYSVTVESKKGTTGDVILEPLQAAGKAVSGEEALSLWTDGSAAKETLIRYINEVTSEESHEFIPVENRVAVFDLDGTLFCETDPNYFDYCLLKYRVLDDPEYKDKASDFEREVARKIVTLNETGTAAQGLETDHGKAVASAFSGMTLDEFYGYIEEFKKQPMPSYDGMTRGEGFYKPMLEVIDYLRANEFTVYIVSGTDRFIVRGICAGSALDIAPDHIIGSDETVVANDQKGADGLDYVFDSDDELILGGDFIIKNLKMNKVSVIAQEIGVQPVLSFGNSTGDSAMADYAVSNNKYRSLAFMLCCDDTERENGSTEKADKMYKLCEEHDWTPISMKNDWTTIYGDGVTKK